MTSLVNYQNCVLSTQESLGLFQTDIEATRKNRNSDWLLKKKCL